MNSEPVIDPWMLPKVGGVYCIFNSSKLMRYVGSSHDIRRRCMGHRSKLESGKHDNEFLQRAWLEDGSASFVWMLLDAIEEPSEMVKAEARHIETFRSGHGDCGYNLILNPCTGSISEAVRKKMSASHKGRIPWNIGIPCPEHVKQASTRLLTGRQKSSEEIAKLRAAMLGSSHPWRGKKFTDATKANMAMAQHVRGPLSGRFKGVYLDRRTETFMARINGSFLGRYSSEVEAAQAYNIAAVEMFGADCFLNDVPHCVPHRSTSRGRPSHAK